MSALGKDKAVNLERYAVNLDELVEVAPGFVMVCGCAVLFIDGYFRLDGVVRVG